MHKPCEVANEMTGFLRTFGSAGRGHNFLKSAGETTHEQRAPETLARVHKHASAAAAAAAAHPSWTALPFPSAFLESATRDARTATRGEKT
jgi:hypothetical protein